MLQLNEQAILSNFPNIELCFETMIHKTVHHYNYSMSIPEGTKCFAWFTQHKQKNVCFLLEVTENKNICRIEQVNTSLGIRDTVLYGTRFTYKNEPFFSIEDIYIHNRKPVGWQSYVNKLTIFKNILASVQTVKLTSNNNIHFGLPIMSENIDDLFHKIGNLPYKIKWIQFRNNHNKSIFIMRPIQSREKTLYTNTVNAKNVVNATTDYNGSRQRVFIVKPDIQNDIYNLYSPENEDIFVDIAYIPDYKTSVMMNKLFRNIKENQNLDALEESDDEEEFENDKLDKFVYLDRSFKMICTFNMKYKKWQPIRLK